MPAVDLPNRDQRVRRSELIATFVAHGLRKATIRKTVSVLAMVLDHHGVQPTPARDPRVKLPREERRELNPPTAQHVLAVHALLPSAYRLPLLTLDATGMRVGELQALTWGDVDEQRGRWRVRAPVAKTGAARWVTPPPELFDAVSALVPRDDRVSDRPVFGGFGADRFRTSLTRACMARRGTDVQPARPTTPPRLATPRAGAVVGADRGTCWPRRPRDDGAYIHPRARRRDRDGLPEDAQSVTESFSISPTWKPGRVRPDFRT